MYRGALSADNPLIHQLCCRVGGDEEQVEGVEVEGVTEVKLLHVLLSVVVVIHVRKTGAKCFYVQGIGSCRVTPSKAVQAPSPNFFAEC